MRTQWMAGGVGLLASLAVATMDVAAQSSPLDGAWVLDTERSENAREILAARAGGGGAAARAGGGPPGGAVMRSGGGGGGRMIIRGGGPLVGNVVQAGQRVRIETGIASVTLHVDDEAPFTLPLSGEAIDVTRGESVVLARARLANGTLTIESEGENGIAFRETFTATDRGEIDAELDLSFPQMGGPVTIVAKRVYVKAPEQTR